MIPNSAHFVFGLGVQDEPMHFLQYVAIESCRRVLEPNTIFLYYHYLPWGYWWDRIAPFVTPVHTQLVADVENADYSDGLVPQKYRYALHADFIRLDALIEHGGIYADMDTIFLRRPQTDLYAEHCVIGEESQLRHPRTGIMMPSLCNAFLMAEPRSRFITTWRERMAGALDGTWSNHSGTLAQRLRDEMPDEVHVEPRPIFYPFGSDPISLYGLLQSQWTIPKESVSVHLWSHLWWDRQRLSSSPAHAGWCAPSALRRASTTLSRLVEAYLPAPRRRSTVETKRVQDPATLRVPPQAKQEAISEPWLYLSYDEDSGYGTAARRTMEALEAVNVDFDWSPLVRSTSWGQRYATPVGYDPFRHGSGRGGVVIAHTTPEYYADLRLATTDAFFVGHTIWETDRLPSRWPQLLEFVDLIVVASELSAQVIRAAGVQTPVEVIPHPLTTSTSEISRVEEHNDDRYVFYTIADWTRRKGVEATIEAYLRAFRRDDPVLLVVKSSPLDHSAFGRAGIRKVEPGTSAWSLSRILARHPFSAAVRLINSPLSDREISDLHNRGDCYVSLSRAEGWGIGAFDAVAAGNPVIATGWGGHLDYLENSPYLVNYQLVPVDEPALLQRNYSPDQHWAEPDIDHAATLMRWVYDHPHEARASASRQSTMVNDRYSPNIVGARWRSVIESHRMGLSTKL